MVSKMVVRRSQCSNLARDSFFSDIIMPTDSIFTPPIAPPPPYSPPEYTAISNDRVLVESNEFMDDMSTPTPVIGPMDMPPPYSTLDLSPGGTTIECSVAQEYQVEPSEIRHIEPRRLGSQTAISNSYNPGRAIITIYQRNNTEQIPTPPLRWDSHHVTRVAPMPRMEQSGCNSIEPHQHHHHHHHSNIANAPAPVQIINNNRRHVKSKSRPRSTSSGGSPRAGQQRQEGRLPCQIIPQQGESSNGLLIVNDGVGPEPRLRSNSGGCLPVVIMRHHRSRPSRGNRVSTASQTSLEGTDNNATNVNSATNAESINVGDRFIPNIPCSVSQNVSTVVSSQCVANLCRAVNQIRGAGCDNSRPANNNEPSRVSVKSKSGLMDRKASSSSGSVSGPTTTSVPSNTKSSSSNERLTGTSSSHTSRDSAIGRRQRRRHSRHAAERRRVSSSTTCSTSPTESSSRSSTSGSFGRGRRGRNRFISTSSSSDSDEDHRHPPPPRRMIARMANGAIKHEMMDPTNAHGSSIGGHREQKHRKNSGSSSNTPSRGRPKHQRSNTEKTTSAGSRRANSSEPQTRNYAPMAVAQAPPIANQPESSMTITSWADTGEQINLRQKRPNSLNLRLRQSHPAIQSRRSHPTAVTFIDESDPWIHRDTGRTYTSVGVQSMPEQTQPTQQYVDSLRKSRESPLRIPMPMDDLPPEIQSSVSAPTPSTTVQDPLTSVPKPKARPKSMVELSQDTSVLVSRFLKQSISGLSPAIKTVLEDIQNVITTDEQYLTEALQSHNIIDGYIEKANSAEKLSCETSTRKPDPELPENKDSPQTPSPLLNPKDLLKLRLVEESGMEEGVLPSSETKFEHSCPDADLIGTSGTKHEALLQGCLAKSLESARETVL
ncbi:uncharacterized protein [Asterias amurensis]|uniref:uncharacterized protein isoform X2 n=1 Tax=Asterias amurensis TaxID=7602 RepID=UPI003AB59CC4